mmetsp:Transcript_11822/g.47709  ORF Transcript_11822/g.47709 Transcript_11822/m.47709 type:complete len:1558 (-) Transcript_11822:87-4760(-)
MVKYDESDDDFMDEESEEMYDEVSEEEYGDDGSPAPVRKGKDTGDASKRYVKKSPLEHVLLRPDTYVGSIETAEEKIWVFDKEKGMNKRKCKYVPGLYKIFDEILVNAADHKQRDPSMTTIKVVIDRDENSISVWNNGEGVPVEIHKDEKIYIPEMIFGHLLTSSNYDDDEKKVTGGRNGYGAKLANIFSTEFTLETADNIRCKKYVQTWTDNMRKAGKAKITKIKETSRSYTCITFKPDLARFHMPDGFDGDTIALLTKRVYDVAGCNPTVNVWLNGERIPIRKFSDYCKLYLKDRDEDKKFVFAVVNDRWQVGITPSDGQLEQVSFVNSISTTRGGSHVDTVVNQVAKHIQNLVNSKQKKGKGVQVKPHQVKHHMWVFVNALIENPAFDSQTKETLTTKVSNFGSRCTLTPEFLKKVNSIGIQQAVLDFARFKESKALKQTGGKKKQRLVGIKKLCDANDAGNKRYSKDCTLILTEGDSAKTLAISGLSVVGRDRYGVFPLRGKLLNARDASSKQIADNEEITNIKKILGLQHGKVYDEEEVKKTLRYGKLMIMTDQDHDGSHIKGLLINFIHKFWPSLLKVPHFMQEFVTPIVKASKGKKEEVFYTMPEYENWKESLDGAPGWKIKYYKGLGTSTPKEAKEYFRDIDTHRLLFNYDGEEADELIDMAFNKKKADERKDWILSIDSETTFVDHSKSTLTYKDFINKELVLFSQADCERSIPSVVDGLKPGQRKVLFSCFKRKLKSDIKVAQLAGYVSEQSAYHHGEVSLMGTIIAMAQNFVGSNNINALVPSGQFGTRLMGGKDAASPRYIFTHLEPIARRLYNETDDHLLEYLDDDGQSIEPKWYVPILPMVLVNGAEGIGTGWSTSIPNYNPVDIVENLKKMIRGEEPEEMQPWYRGFTGSIELDPKKKNYVVRGCWEEIDENTIHISELPIRTWTQQYKEFLESMLIDAPNANKKAMLTDYRDNCGDSTVSFTVTFAEGKLAELLKTDKLESTMKLKSTMMSTSNMHLFSASGAIKKYDTVADILREFFELRLKFYHSRKEYLVKIKKSEVSRISNRVRFILAVINKEIILANRKKADLLAQLEEDGYDKMPKKMQNTRAKNAIITEEEYEESNASYDYLLSMPLWSLTLERVEQLKKEKEERTQELEILLSRTKEQMWEADLDDLTEALEEFENARLKNNKGIKKKKRAGARGDDDDYELDAKPKKKRAPVKKKAAPAAKPKKKATPKLELDDDDDFLDDEEDFAPPKKTKAAAKPKARARAAPAKKKTTAKAEPDGDGDFAMDEESDGGGGAGEKATAKPRAKGRATKARAKARVIGDDSSDDDFDLALEESPAPKKKAAPARRRAAAKVKVEEDSDGDFAMEELSDDEVADVKPKAKPRARAAVKARVISDDDDDFNDSPLPKKATGKRAKTAAPAKQAKTTKRSVLAMLESDSEDEFDFLKGKLSGSKAKPKAAAKAKAVAKPKAKAAAKPKPKAAAKKRVIEESESDEEEEEVKEVKVARKAAPARRRAATKRIVYSSEEEEDDGDDDALIYDESEEDDYEEDEYSE